MMNFQGVINNDDEILRKINIEKNLFKPMTVIILFAWEQMIKILFQLSMKFYD